jgi:hypothetical protein
MDTATLESPPKRTRPPLNGPIPALPHDKEAVKLASIGGLEDKDIAAQHKDLKPATIRNWRERDPAWSAAYYATREGRRKGNPPAVIRKAREAQEAHNLARLKANAPNTLVAPSRTSSPLVTHDLITEGVPILASRNRLRLAYEVDRALAKRTKSKKALPIASFAELNQAARALLYAEGRDADAPALTLNVWGNPGLQAQQSTGGFRDLPAIDAETNAGA